MRFTTFEKRSDTAYGSASELKATLDYDFSHEKNYSYKGLSMDDTIHHLAKFISGLWQIHVFGEGNTRTTAVFFIKYLRTLGFDVTNDIFAENAWYFRNALVRANYNDLKKDIHETTEYLELFLRNLMLDEKNELHNRATHVRRMFVNYKKPYIGDKKPYIGGEKPDIRIMHIYQERIQELSSIVQNQVLKMYNTFGIEQVFGRSDVEKVLDLKSSRTSELLKKLQEAGIIVPVKGHGKGKYTFLK